MTFSERVGQVAGVLTLGLLGGCLLALLIAMVGATVKVIAWLL